MKHFTALSCMLATALFTFAQIPSKYKFLKGEANIKIGTESYQSGLTGGINTAYISTADLDNDGLLDLVIFDRNQSKYLTFINNGNSSSAFDYNPYYENFLEAPRDYAIFKDFNGDGKKDLFYKNEYDYLSIKYNITQTGDKHIMFKDPVVVLYYDRAYLNFLELNTRQTDLPVVQDLDGDGDIDFLDYNPGIQPTVQFFKNQQMEDGLSGKDTTVFEMVDFCWGHFSESASVDKVNIGQCPVNSKFYRHLGGASLLSYDFDNDGDFDLVMGNSGYNGAIYLENGKSDYSWWQDSVISQHNSFPNATKPINVTTMAFFFMEDLNNDGKLDFIAMPGDLTESKDIANVEVYYNSGTNALPVYTTVNKGFLSDKNFDLGSNSSPALWDYDNDGDDDLFVAATGDYTSTTHEADRVYLFKNNNGVFEQTSTDYANFSTQKIQDLTIHFGDVNGDNLEDLVYGKRNGEVAWKKNTGTKGVPNFVDQGVLVASTFSNANSFPCLHDFNDDGKNDLLIGNDIGNIFYYEQEADTFKLITDTFGGVRTNFLQSNGSLSYFGYSTPTVQDINGDGQYELISGTFNGKIRAWGINSENPTDLFHAYSNVAYVHESGDTTAYLNSGYYSKTAIGYIDNDTFLDLIVGTKSGGLQVFYGQKGNNDKAVSTKEIIKTQLAVYPNPVKEHLTIRRDNLAEALFVSMVNYLGQQVRSIDLDGNSTNISTRELDAGLYFLIAKNSQGQIVWSGKVVKQD